MSVNRRISAVAAVAAIAVASGFLIGYPADVTAATTIAFAAFVSLITIRDLFARTKLRTRARPAADSMRLEQLRRIDQTLAAARASEAGVNRELRPLFRAIAATRLARRGVDVDRNAEEARALLGDELWELVRAERPRGSDLSPGGISTIELQSLIERLERI